MITNFERSCVDASSPSSRLHRAPSSPRSGSRVPNLHFGYPLDRKSAVMGCERCDRFQGLAVGPETSSALAQNHPNRVDPVLSDGAVISLQFASRQWLMEAHSQCASSSSVGHHIRVQSELFFEAPYRILIWVRAQFLSWAMNSRSRKAAHVLMAARKAFASVAADSASKATCAGFSIRLHSIANRASSSFRNSGSRLFIATGLNCCKAHSTC